jgi:hypothetical protein
MPWEKVFEIMVVERSPAAPAATSSKKPSYEGEVAGYDDPLLPVATPDADSSGSAEDGVLDVEDETRVTRLAHKFFNKQWIGTLVVSRIICVSSLYIYMHLYLSLSFFLSGRFILMRNDHSVGRRPDQWRLHICQPRERRYCDSHDPL